MSRFNNLEFSGRSEERSQSRETVRAKADRVVKDGAYYLTQAQGAFENGLFEEALRHYARAIEFDSENPAAWCGQVRMLIELGEFEEAGRWAGKALERFPRDAELLAAKAVSLARQGDVEAATVYSDASIEERGDTPYVWLARGDVQMARQEERAGYCFERAAAMAPKNWLVRWLAARIHRFYRKFALAIKLVQEALALNAGQGILWLELGFCQQALGLLQPAHASFDHARQFDVQSRAADDALRALAGSGLWHRVRQGCRRLFRR